MCTVTFIAKKRGYHLGMNRDEKRTRPTGLPPEKRMVSGRAVLCPSEAGGGTWIAVNDAGVTIALVNWYAITARVARNAMSRGDVVNVASPAASPEAAGAAIAMLPLARINAFRLIGIFPSIREIVEWRWDLKKLLRVAHPWKTRQWISSGYDEPAAQKARGRTFRQACRQVSSGSINWLRRLHRSHFPGTGPFSTCMHRADAVTVSYTEINVSFNNAKMLYYTGSPCEQSRFVIAKATRLELVRPELEE